MEYIHKAKFGIPEGGVVVKKWLEAAADGTRVERYSTEVDEFNGLKVGDAIRVPDDYQGALAPGVYRAVAFTKAGCVLVGLPGGEEIVGWADVYAVRRADGWAAGGGDGEPLRRQPFVEIGGKRYLIFPNKK